MGAGRKDSKGARGIVVVLVPITRDFAVELGTQFVVGSYGVVELVPLRRLEPLRESAADLVLATGLELVQYALDSVLGGTGKLGQTRGPRRCVGNGAFDGESGELIDA